MNTKNISILVTGVGGGGVGRQIMKSLRLTKYPYRIIGTDIIKESSGLPEADKAYIVPRAHEQNYIPKILEICRKENVKCVAPGTENELLRISQEKDIFSKEDIMVLANSHNIIKLCLDKGKLFNFLKQNKVKIPRFQVVDQVNKLKKIEYPVVIKPTTGSGSRSVFIAETYDEARFFVKYLTGRKMEVIVQEYVGSFEEEYTVGILRLDKGKIKRSIALKRDLGKSLSCREMLDSKFGEKKFAISTGISQGLFDDYQEVRKACEKISDVLEAEGPINIQCRKVGNEIIPFEINPRFSGTTSLRSMVGFHEPHFMIRYLLFNEIPKSFRVKKTYVSRDLVEKVV